MKSVSIIFIVILLTSTMAEQIRPASLATIRKIDKLLKEKNSWSSIIINMAILNAKAGNPIDGLVDGINKVINDIENKMAEENDQFDLRTGQHNQVTKQLNREIDDVNVFITRTEIFISEVLVVMKNTLEKELRQIADYIKKTNQFLKEAAVSRQMEHDEYLAKLEDGYAGIQVVGEAWEVLSELLDDNTSLVQINKAKIQIHKVQRKFQKSGHSTDQAIIKALLELSSNYSDQTLVRQVLDALNSVRESLKNALEKFAVEEERAEQDYANLVEDKKRELYFYESETIEKKKQLEATERKIETNQAAVDEKKKDLLELQDSLEIEKRNYEVSCKTHEDLINQMTKEFNACTEALQILSSAEFSGYIADRIENAGSYGVIGTHEDTGRAKINVSNRY